MFRFLVFAAVAVLTTIPLQAQEAKLRMPSCFGNHMVLQQNQHAKIWGWAGPKEVVSVAFDGKVIDTVADDKGDWFVMLPKMLADSNPTKLTVKSGEQEIAFEDILIGEVWFASGQSNMAWSLKGTDDAEKEIASADMPKVRMFLAAPTPAKTPQTDIKGEWKVCTPENSPAFSAVGYYFAKKIHQETGVPVGIIKSVIGGKRCECYCSREAMLSNENGKKMIAELDKQAESFDAEKAKANFDKAMAKWETKTNEIRQANKDLPQAQKKKLPRKPRMQTHPMMNPGNPTILYNGMINPFVGYNMRGAIWYQGESNCNPALAPIYKEMFTLMIQDWRTRWNEDFPFYYVQLANFRAPTTEPGVENEWPTVQEQQRLTLEFPFTGMATINDIGDAKDIHPRNKSDVGKRLARWALKNQYGRDVVVSGPLYAGVTVDNEKMIIEFDHVAGGLRSRDGGPLKRFEIAGEDKKWHWADANIVDNNVEVTCKDVPKPVAVRYAWASNPEGANLVNSEGLPASIFQTHQWEPKNKK